MVPPPLEGNHGRHQSSVSEVARFDQARPFQRYLTLGWFLALLLARWFWKRLLGQAGGILE